MKSQVDPAIRRASWWMFVAPIGLFAAYALESHPIVFAAETWKNGLWGASAAPTYWSIQGIFRNLGSANPTEVKIFNEQIKMMANTINALAIAVFVVALVQPMVNTTGLTLREGLLFVLGLFLRTRTYGILAYTKPDP